MVERKIKGLAFAEKIGYIMVNIPATPPKLRLSAHFGRVFPFIEHIHRAFAERQAKSGGFSFLWGCYGKI